MFLDFLSKKFLEAINNINVTKLYEIRLRSGFPVVVNFNGKNMFLSKNRLTLIKNEAIICDKNDIDCIIGLVTEYSVYSYNEQIKRGYVTTKDGVRIGLAGECVFENGQIFTIKNITSLNIRVPHNITGSANEVFKYVYNNNKISNTLIVSKPCQGKTTILKDLLNRLNGLNYNILLIDERSELSVELNNYMVDVIKYSDKRYAFEYGIRSLSPALIVTDEISTKEDWNCVESVINSGLNVIASCHSNSLKELMSKEFFKNVFDCYVILSDRQVGEINSVYNNKFLKLNNG